MAIGQCPYEQRFFYVGASLITPLTFCFVLIYVRNMMFKVLFSSYGTMTNCSTCFLFCLDLREKCDVYKSEKCDVYKSEKYDVYKSEKYDV